ncbi:hypothetical protein M422DRAFT_242596 [Sphaerobolus stellatus SS14]|nr:hypothetical protein M422DRAFT_242596 [Sphaerobolus stellatus SS14]
MPQPLIPTQEIAKLSIKAEDDDNMAPSPSMPLFRGEYEGNENPQTWLQTFSTQTFVAGWDNAKSITYFGMLMEEGYDAGHWWAESQRKWPRMEEMEPEKDAKRRALKGLRLKEEEVGKTIKFRGREVLSHCTFMTQTLELATAIGNPSGLLIEGVQENLSESIQRLILNNSHDTWQEFYDSLTKIKIPTIKRAQWDAEAMSRFTWLADIMENSQQPTT